MAHEPPLYAVGAQRFVIVGVGRWGQVHLKRWSQLLGRQVDLVVDPRPVSSQHARGWRSSLECCAPSELWGATAVVTTPISLLAPITTQLIHLGVKAVLIEKPGACTPQELSLVHALAREADVRVAVGYIERFNDATTALIEALKSWWVSEPQRPWLEIRRSGGEASANSAPKHLDLWCHDVNLLKLAAREAQRAPLSAGLSVDPRGLLWLSGVNIGAVCQATSDRERRWSIGERSFELTPQGGHTAGVLDPLSLQCLAFARWATEGVWSSSLCALDEAIDTLSALTDHR